MRATCSSCPTSVSITASSQTVADTPLFRNALTLEGDGDACEDPHASTPLMLHLRPDEPDVSVTRTAI